MGLWLSQTQLIYLKVNLRHNFQVVAKHTTSTEIFPHFNITSRFLELVLRRGKSQMIMEPGPKASHDALKSRCSMKIFQESDVDPNGEPSPVQAVINLRRRGSRYVTLSPRVLP
jgi:hypothetical protein